MSTREPNLSGGRSECGREWRRRASPSSVANFVALSASPRRVPPTGPGGACLIRQRTGDDFGLGRPVRVPLKAPEDKRYVVIRLRRRRHQPKGTRKRGSLVALMAGPTHGRALVRETEPSGPPREIPLLVLLIAWPQNGSRGARGPYGEARPGPGRLDSEGRIDRSVHELGPR